MKTITGKFNEAKIFTDTVDENALSQIESLCDREEFKDSRIRIMPDVHAGKGCTIGTTMTIKDKAVPNMVGVDIGCGMELVRLEEKRIDLCALDKAVYTKIPSGMNIRETEHKFAADIDLGSLRARKINLDRAYKSIGTLGGGNHFIEVDKDEEGNLYLVVHSGSRHLGVDVADYYQNEGYRALCGNSSRQIDEVIAALKSEGREKEIETTVRELKSRERPADRTTAYVEGELFDDYIHDMKLVQEFADLNRKAMVYELTRKLKLTVADSLTTVHNYIDTENMILRKGAVSAAKGERLLVPINMRDGSLICVGKGNPDWNMSAPHGAGRLMSRAEARTRLTVSAFRHEMSGIYSTSVNADTLDESPMAYKKLKDITENITPTAEIVKRIVPVYNFKASEEISFGKNAPRRKK